MGVRHLFPTDRGISLLNIDPDSGWDSSSQHCGSISSFSPRIQLVSNTLAPAGTSTTQSYTLYFSSRSSLADELLPNDQHQLITEWDSRMRFSWPEWEPTWVNLSIFQILLEAYRCYTSCASGRDRQTSSAGAGCSACSIKPKSCSLACRSSRIVPLIRDVSGDNGLSEACWGRVNGGADIGFLLHSGKVPTLHICCSGW